MEKNLRSMGLLAADGARVLDARRDVEDYLEQLDRQQPEPGRRTAEELNLPARKLFEFITSDFESAWAAFSAMRPRPGASGRGNMMFARQAMTLFEFACRLYGNDDRARLDFSRALLDIEPRYFTEMPGPCIGRSSLRLPFHPEKGSQTSDRVLINALFDLTRHGLAHQYQAITAVLTDRRVLVISVSGANYGEGLGTNIPRERYLGYLKANYNDLVIRLFPDALYVDVKAAIERTDLLGRGLVPQFLERGGDLGEPETYRFDASAVEAALKRAGHPRVVGAPGT
jgi:hypothetical protein